MMSERRVGLPVHESKLFHSIGVLMVMGTDVVFAMLAVAVKDHVGVDLEVGMAMQVSDSRLGQDLLIAQLQMVGRCVVGPVERFEDGIGEEQWL